MGTRLQSVLIGIAVVLPALFLPGCGKKTETEVSETAQHLAKLEDVDPKVRSRAALELGRLQAQEAAGPVVELLGDIHPDVRKAAIEALGMIGAREGAVPLGRIVTSDREPGGVRRMAAYSLGQVGHADGVPALAEGMRSQDENLAYACVHALGNIPHDAAVTVLIEAIDKGTPTIQRAAAGLLGGYAGELALAKSRSLLTSRDPKLRLAAAEHLAGNLDTKALDGLIVLLGDSDRKVRGKMPKLIAGFGSDVIEPMTKLLARKPPADRNAARALALAQGSAVEVLKEFQGKAVIRALVAAGTAGGPAYRSAQSQLTRRMNDRDCRETVMAVFKSGSAAERSFIVRFASGYLRGKVPGNSTKEKRDTALREAGFDTLRPAIEELAGWLKSKDKNTRIQAAGTLCSLGDVRGRDIILGELRAQVQGDRILSRGSVQNSLRLLGPVANQAVADVMCPVFQKGDFDTSLAITMVPIFSGTRDSRFAPPLIAALERKIKGTQKGKLSRGPGTTESKLCQALGAVGDKRAVPMIYKHLKRYGNHHWWSSSKIIPAESILQCDLDEGYKNLMKMLKEVHSVNAELIGALSTMTTRYPDKRAIPALLLWVNHDVGKVRDVVHAALGFHGRNHMDWLIDAFDEASYVQRQGLAAVITDTIGEPARAALLEAAKDKRPKVRQGVVWTLGCLSGEGARDIVEAGLKDEHPQVRAAAAWSVVALNDATLADLVIGLLKDSDAAPRAMAADRLGELGVKTAVQPLIAALKDESAEVRGVAAISLAKLRAEDALDELEPLLKDENHKVQAAAEYAIRVLKAPPAAPAKEQG